MAFSNADTSNGSILIEHVLSRISSLKLKLDEIIGNPHASASTIALQHPSANVGKTKKSAAFKYVTSSLWGTRPLNIICSVSSGGFPSPIKINFKEGILFAH